MAITGIVAKNSLDFLVKAFQFLDERKVFFPLVQDKFRLPSFMKIDDIVEPVISNGWFRNHHQTFHQPTPAQINFTSGTEGESKGIILTHSNLADPIDRLNRLMQVDNSIREYVGVPVYYSFGFGRFRACAAAGGAAYLPPKGFDLLELTRMLAAGEINAISAVPTLWRMALANSHVFGRHAKAVRWIEIGSQSMTGAEKLAMRELFPNARIVQHYGLTEASRSTLLDISSCPNEELDSVGRSYGETEVRISVEGLIQLRGPHVAKQRIGPDGPIALVDPQGWFTTSDLGSLEGGYLRFEGRADDMINCGGIKLSPDLIEDRLRSSLFVGDRLAVARVPHPIRGEGVLVAVEGSASLEAVEIAATQTLASMGVAAPDAVNVVHVGSLPLTETGKVQRRILTQQFADISITKTNPACEGGKVGTDSIDSIRIFYQSLRPSLPLTGDASFASLGGDSLSYVQATIIIEEALGHLPPQWERMPISSMVGVAKSTKKSGTFLKFRSVEGEMLARMFAITLITMSHVWYPLEWFGVGVGGGAALLISIFGYNIFRFRYNILLGNRPFRIVPTIFLRYILPYYAVIIFFAIREGFHWQAFFLSGVFFSGPPGALHMYWFFESLFHLCIMLGLIFSLPSVRRAISNHPDRMVLMLVAGAIFVRIAVESIRPVLGIAPRTPDAFLYLALGGLGIAAARHLQTRVAVAAMMVATQMFLWGADESQWVVLAIGLACLILLPRVSIPAPLATVVRQVARSTIYIYLCSGFVIRIFQVALKNEFLWGHFFATFIVGIAAERFVDFARGWWSSRSSTSQPHRLAEADA